jgi:hypothetical protein
MRKKAVKMRPVRLLQNVINKWREWVTNRCVLIPLQLVSLLRLRSCWDSWRTLRSKLLLRTVSSSREWVSRRVSGFFRRWSNVYATKLKLGSGSNKLFHCRRKYQLRCSLFRWEGWREERLAQALLSKIKGRKNNMNNYPSCVVGGLFHSWDEVMFAHRWSHDDTEYDDLIHHLSGDSLIVCKQLVSPETQHISGSFDKLFSAEVTSRSEFKEGNNSKKQIKFRANPVDSVSANDRIRGKLIKHKVARQTSVVDTIDKSVGKSVSLNRALILGYCGIKSHSQIPIIRCLRAIFIAFRSFVRKRKHCRLAFVYYKNSKTHGMLSQSFHVWVGRVPELAHRGSSWLVVDQPKSNVFSSKY